MAKKTYLDESGLIYLWGKIKEALGKKVDTVENMGLSSNDFTTDLKTKLENIPDNVTANEGTITGVSVDGESIATSGVANIPAASTTKKGVVQLSTATDGNSTQKAATESAVAEAYNLAKSKASKATTLSGYGIGDAYTKSEVYNKTEVDAKVSSVYKPAGSVTGSALPTPDQSNLGNVYNVSTSFTTNNNFVEGADKEYPAGTNIVVVEVSGSYKLDVLAGFIDTSDFITEDDISSITNETIDSITA